MCLQRFLHLLSTLKHVTNDDIPLSDDDQEIRSSILLDVESNLRLIEAFVPMLNTISHWMQSLSKYENVTISLVIQRQKNLKTCVCFSSETCTLTSNYFDLHDYEESDLVMSDSEVDNE